jgi:TRAP-type C4-dicarboxylate transport system substrate-binding protein
MQLKLKLPGTVLDLPAQIWDQLDPDAQKMVVQALVKAMVKREAEQENKNGEGNHDRE